MWKKCSAVLVSQTETTHRLLKLQLASNPEENRFYHSRGLTDFLNAVLMRWPFEAPFYAAAPIIGAAIVRLSNDEKEMQNPKRLTLDPLQ
ncbi:hypothetical protein EYF80_004531 [Liparis tanakae]|uniref:Uncharacterized protein n=1 Tax=Liparis tanakae TaxID=230148 RepID=A0A4Z2J5H9_9TELE|nr:hypothetical protein EYF80_004531 [Liparis tanakae]